MFYNVRQVCWWHCLSVCLQVTWPEESQWSLTWAILVFGFAFGFWMGDANQFYILVCVEQLTTTVLFTAVSVQHQPISIVRRRVQVAQCNDISNVAMQCIGVCRIYIDVQLYMYMTRIMNQHLPMAEEIGLFATSLFSLWSNHGGHNVVNSTLYITTKWPPS